MWLFESVGYPGGSKREGPERQITQKSYYVKKIPLTYCKNPIIIIIIIIEFLLRNSYY